MPYGKILVDQVESSTGKVLSTGQVTSELNAIARSLNVADTAVIYSTDTVTVLDNVLYIYDAAAQTTWGVPTLDSTGKTIVSVVGSALTTTGGTGGNSYTLTTINKSGIQFETIADVDTGYSVGGKVNLLVGDSISVLDYAAGNKSGVLFFSVVSPGTGVDDGGEYIDLPSTGLQLKQNLKYPYEVKAWGAVGDDVADDTDAVENTIIYAEATQSRRQSVVKFPNGTYKITRTIDILECSLQGFGNYAGPDLQQFSTFEAGATLKSYVNLAPMLYTTNASLYTHSNIIFAEDSSVATESLIEIDADVWNGSRFDRVFFSGGDRAITVNGGAVGLGLTLENCYISNQRKAPIYSTGSNFTFNDSINILIQNLMCDMADDGFIEIINTEFDIKIQNSYFEHLSAPADISFIDNQNTAGQVFGVLSMKDVGFGVTFAGTSELSTMFRGKNFNNPPNIKLDSIALPFSEYLYLQQDNVTNPSSAIELPRISRTDIVTYGVQSARTLHIQTSYNNSIQEIGGGDLAYTRVVSENRGEILKISNSTPTTVGAIFGGYAGQRVLLLADDSNTTIDASANLNGNGGANVVLSTGDALDLTCTSGAGGNSTWYFNVIAK